MHDETRSDEGPSDPEFLLKTAVRDVKKETLHIYNRLHSIDLDSRYVEKVCKEFAPLPVIGNERCGAWYTGPKQAPIASAYFKSTDGHTGQWTFSLRRANLHLLPIADEQQGRGLRTGPLGISLYCYRFIIVDATRRDALSKTVPLWCAVINEAARRVHGDAFCASHTLVTPDNIISPSEHAQMLQKISGAASDLLASSTGRQAVQSIRRPLQPVFASPSMPIPTWRKSPSTSTVVCLSASRDDAAHSRQYGFSYVPGAGDDHESWSHGLTPSLFRSHRLQILAVSREDIHQVIEEVVADCQQSASHVKSFLDLKPTAIRLDIDMCQYEQIVDDSLAIIWVIPTHDEVHAGTDDGVCILPIAAGKKGHQHLMDALSGCLTFAEQRLGEDRTLWIRYTQAELKDAAITIALACIVCLHDDELCFQISLDHTITKSLITNRLHWLTTVSSGRVNPSRAILTRLNGTLIAR